MTTHRLLRYLCTLPAAQIQDVLRHEGCGQAVFRLLPSVAKHLVLRTAFVDVPISRGASKMGNKSVHAMRREEKADLDETNRRGDGVDGRNGPRDDGRRLGTAGGTAGEDGNRVKRTWMEDVDLVLTSCGYSSSKKRGWNQEVGNEGLSRPTSCLDCDACYVQPVPSDPHWDCAWNGTKTYKTWIDGAKTDGNRSCSTCWER